MEMISDYTARTCKRKAAVRY